MLWYQSPFFHHRVRCTRFTILWVQGTYTKMDNDQFIVTLSWEILTKCCLHSGYILDFMPARFRCIFLNIKQITMYLIYGCFVPLASYAFAIFRSIFNIRSLFWNFRWSFWYQCDQLVMDRIYLTLSYNLELILTCLLRGPKPVGHPVHRRLLIVLQIHLPKRYKQYWLLPSSAKGLSSSCSRYRLLCNGSL